MVTNGYQPGTTNPSSRRADFDLRRRLLDLEEIVAGLVPGGGGPGGPVSYVHQQSTPASTWSIAHGLGWYPGGILVSDSAGTDVEGDVTHVNDLLLTITFSGAFSGTAYLS